MSSSLSLKDYDEKIGPACKAVGMPDAVFSELIEEWVRFRIKHADKDPEDISFEYELFPTTEGLISVVLEPDQGQMAVTVKAEDIDFDDSEGGSGAVRELHQVPPEAWVAILPTEQLQADRKVQPNAPCPCGSGRKAKKCCQNK